MKGATKKGSVSKLLAKAGPEAGAGARSKSIRIRIQLSLWYRPWGQGKGFGGHERISGTLGGQGGWWGGDAVGCGSGNAASARSR